MLSVLSTQVGEIPVSEFGLGTYFRPVWTHVSIPGTSLDFYLAQSMEASENTLKISRNRANSTMRSLRDLELTRSAVM